MNYAGTGACFAYTYADTATAGTTGTSKCWVLNAAATAATNTGSGGTCYNVPGMSDWKTKTAAVKTKWTALNATASAAQKAMETETDKQAVLEETWYKAWLVGQYWVQVEAHLDSASADSPYKVYATTKATLDDA